MNTVARSSCEIRKLFHGIEEKERIERCINYTCEFHSMTASNPEVSPKMVFI